jgi:hypothetical protein
MVLEGVFANNEAFAGALAGGVIGFLILFGVMMALLIGLAIYLYYSWAWYVIAQKLKHKKPWLAWIPIVKWAMILQLGGFHWAWIFLIFIPVLGWLALFILWIITTWRVFESRNYPGWFSLSLIIPKVGFVLYLVALGFVAWQDKSGYGNIRNKRFKSRKKRTRRR